MIYINAHEIVLDSKERLEAWTSYDRIIRLAMDFIKDCPVDQSNELSWYLQYSCFWIDPLRPTVWPDNPAGKFAWACTTLLKYYPFSGDDRHIAIVRNMLERLWEYRTPESCSWGEIPYSSAHPGTGIYFGDRADGEYVTEPDKVAQVGKAFLDFYKLSGEDRFFRMGEHCAQVLSKKIRAGDEKHSPLPFRVSVRDGKIIEEYTAHMIAAVRLFDEMIRFGENQYQDYRDCVWNWIEKFPLKNNIWKGYFEDIRLDPENKNRDQLSPMETARYLLENKEKYPDWKRIVKDLIDWVIETLGGPSFFSAIPIHEQKFCYFLTGSHTARFASVCAQYAEQTGDEKYREMEMRSLNWASYMANEDGTVTVGIDRPDYYNQCWFTDGYFDYVPHVIDCLAALPELAPDDADHMLRSTSVVQEISYQPQKIIYRTYGADGCQRLKLTFEPHQVIAGGKLLGRKETLNDQPGWTLGHFPYVVDIKPGAQQVELRGK